MLTWQCRQPDRQDSPQSSLPDVDNHEYSDDDNSHLHSSVSSGGDIGSKAAQDQLVLHQIQFIVPMVIGILLVVVLTTGVAVCMKRSEL